MRAEPAVFRPRQLDSEASERITLLRFLLIVGVVFIHAYDTEVTVAGKVLGVNSPDSLGTLIRDFISQGFARTAVPLFFLLAGYFFFRNFDWSLGGYTAKLKARLHTLLIPFLCWNGFNLLFLLTAQNTPITQPYFSGVNQPILQYSFYDYVNQIIGLEGFPIAYQFWFIRDLMVVVLFAPLVYLALRYAPRTILVILSGLWFFNQWMWYFPSVGAVAFFYAGAYLGVKGRDLFSWDAHGKKFLVVYAVVLVADTLTKHAAYSDYLNRLGILLGMVAVLYLTKSIVRRPRLHSVLRWASSGSFFVFAIHEPLLRTLRKISYEILKPSSDLSILILYFVVPVLVIALSLMIFELLKAVTPGLVRIITGGRTPQRQNR